MASSPRPYRAGESLEDYCRACKTDRLHTIVATDASGAPLRVVCGYCHSEHNFRGGPRIDGPASTSPTATSRVHRQSVPERESFPLISERERTMEPVTNESPDLELLLRRIIREETGLTAVAPAPKWRGGTLALRPGPSGGQEKAWPIETFFHKIVMVRNRLRTLEQVVNASAISDEDKVRIQSHITGCYGSLTSFNVLFGDEEDHFKGSGGE